MLNISASIGFNNQHKDSVVVHPSDMHFLWAQGCVLVVKSIGQENNTYLKGHEGRICTITCSKNGALVATGESHNSGFNAAIIIWDF